jgi:hypothetical protein
LTDRFGSSQVTARLTPNFFESLPADGFPVTVALAGALTAGASGDERR